METANRDLPAGAVRLEPVEAVRPAGGPFDQRVSLVRFVRLPGWARSADIWGKNPQLSSGPGWIYRPEELAAESAVEPTTAEPEITTVRLADDESAERSAA